MSNFGNITKYISLVYNTPRSLIHKLRSYNKIKLSSFRVNFKYDGGICINLPRKGIIKYLYEEIMFNEKNSQFFERTNKEVLLRSIVFLLFNKSVISSSKSIIDIGCWLSDNTLVWSKFIDSSANVYAIDPSSQNIIFGKRLAQFNLIENIVWVEAVCSDDTGHSLYYTGNLDHASFSNKKISKNKVVSSKTLDTIVENSLHSDIGLIHVDVEGMEEPVLRGAEKIIQSGKPFILFEHHLNEYEKFKSLKHYIESLRYAIFMINEVLPGCRLDCRNFLAIHEDNDIDHILEILKVLTPQLDVFPAMLGIPLIRI